MLHRDAYRYEEAPPSYGYSDRGGYAAPYTSGGPITDRCALSWRHFLSCRCVEKVGNASHSGKCRTALISGERCKH